MTVTRKDGDTRRRYSDSILLDDGEGVPLGLLYLLLAAVVPAVAVVLFR